MKVKRILSIVLAVAYFYIIWQSFQEALRIIPYNFGYLDSQHQWRGLEEVLHFHVPFKDYFYEYGWFYLFMQLPAYVLAGRNFLALVITRNLYIPIIGVIISVYIARKTLKGGYLILLFLFFCLLFEVNYNYSSPRHLLSELGLTFFVSSYLSKNKKGFFVSGIITGLAVLTALEYGIVANLAIIAIVLVASVFRFKFGRLSLRKFIKGEGLVLVPFYGWLLINGALTNYWRFTIGFMNKFYTASPCSGMSFPRISDINNLAPSSRLLLFSKIPIEFLQQVNYYVVAFFYIAVFVFLLIKGIQKKKYSKNDFVIFVLGIYGSMIYVRTFSTPCTGYFSYSLIPFFLAVCLVIGYLISFVKRKRQLAKISVALLVILVVSWFTVSEYTWTVAKVFGKKIPKKPAEITQEVFYSPAGVKMKSELVENYEQITKFIIENTKESDYLFVFPWGPYNQITRRKYPVSVTNHLQVGILGKYFEKFTLQELQVRQPNFVIVNLYNNLGVAILGKTRTDLARYLALDNILGPVFSSEKDQVAKYILENYETVFSNKSALVMKKRQNAVKVLPKDEVTEIITKFDNRTEEVNSHEVSQYYPFNKATNISAMEIDFRVGANLVTKYLSRFTVEFFVKIPNRNDVIPVFREVASRDWQTVKIPFVKEFVIEGVGIKTGTSRGFAWWMKPGELSVKEIRLMNFLVPPALSDKE